MMKATNLVLLLSPLFLATTCLQTNPIKISQSLSKCPASEFVLPFYGKTKDAEIKLVWQDNVPEYKVMRLAQITDDVELHRVLSGTHRHFHVGIEKSKTCNLTFLITAFDIKGEFKKDKLFSHIKLKEKTYKVLAEALLSSTTLKLRGEPTFEWISLKESELLKKQMAVKPIYPKKFKK